MADRYDPKVTVRPMTDRKGSDSPAAKDDPLFELARIVSGRGGAAAPAAPPEPPAPAPSASARARPASEPAKPAASEPDVLGDLEAELLSDLHASFAAVKEAIDPARSEPPPGPKASPPPASPTASAFAQPEPPAEPLRPSRFDAPPSSTASPPPPSPAPTAPLHHPPTSHAATPHTTTPHTTTPHAAAPHTAPAAPSSASRLSAAARPPLQQVPPRQPAAPAAPPPRERPHAPPQASANPPPAGLKKVEVSNLTLRPTTAPNVRVTTAPPPSAPATPAAAAPPAAPPPAAPPPVRAAAAAAPPPVKPPAAALRSSRWNKPAEPPKPQASLASRFAPPRAGGQQPSAPPTATDAEDEFAFGEGLPFAHDAEDGDTAEEFPFDLAPGFGDDAEVPPYPEDDELEPLRRRGVPRSLVVIVGILALVLVGVLGFVMLRPGASSDGAPPIIAADAGPTKIAPPVAPSNGNNDQQNKLIYDRVDSSSSGAAAPDSKLVTPGNQQIASVPSGEDPNNPISRVILPGGPAPVVPGTADAGASDTGTADTGNAAATSSDANADSIGPRKVRTVIVRPDGTIVSSDAVPASGDAPAAGTNDAAPAAPPPAPVVPPVATNDDTAAISGGRSGQDLPITANPAPAGNGSVNAAPVAPAPLTTAPATTAQARPPTPVPTPLRAPAAAPQAVANSGGPIDLTPGTGGTTTQVASAEPSGQGAALPVAASGMMVQVSSQRSEDAAKATFRDLQTRYPNILGGYQPDIQRADLGSRGTYYRVRVGPFANADAQQLCSTLKGAGGDCILAPR